MSFRYDLKYLSPQVKAIITERDKCNKETEEIVKSKINSKQVELNIISDERIVKQIELNNEDLFAIYLNDKRTDKGKKSLTRKKIDYPDSINQISKYYNCNIYNLTLIELENFIINNFINLAQKNNNKRWINALKRYKEYLLSL